MKCVWTTRKDNVKLFSAFLVEIGQVLKPQVEREQAGSKRGASGEQAGSKREHCQKHQAPSKHHGSKCLEPSLFFGLVIGYPLFDLHCAGSLVAS